LAVLCLEGGGRSSGASLLRDLSASGADNELFKQLRPVSVSGEADTADGVERAGRQAASDLRRRRQHSRLAVCRRSLFGAVAGLEAGRAGCEVHPRGVERENQFAGSRSDLRGARAGLARRGESLDEGETVCELRRLEELCGGSSWTRSTICNRRLKGSP